MTSSPLIGVLALQGDVKEHELALEAVGAHTTRVRAVEDLKAIDGLVIPGGESTTMSNLAIRMGLLEPLRAVSSAGMPMYGSCAGMIMLANTVIDARPDQQTIGGLDVTVRRNAFGRQIDSFEIDLEIPAVGELPFRAVFIRAPLVESPGPGVEVLSTLRRGGAAGTIVAVRQGVRLATSFHPELTGDTRIHDLFVQIVRQCS
ncbi:MAG: pyridoxal 5'-phosphate synthase glutaminase subunit PdxT [Candidatus Nanopelagicales bacterium]|nr:pyridoxal 5'-phosphate synthase glutaminase subunit PdxT [Candidatus Nanopelagicales bacterium]